jgi:hypothetical protein
MIRYFFNHLHFYALNMNLVILVFIVHLRVGKDQTGFFSSQIHQVKNIIGSYSIISDRP